MIAIKNIINRDLNTLALEHFNAVNGILKKKIPLHLNDNLIAHHFITTHLQKIITGTPKEIIEINNGLKDLFTNAAYKELLIKLKLVFDYGTFITTKKNTKENLSYDLAKKIGLNTCPYCNRNYTVTVFRKSALSEPIVRPDFDHFFPKNEYPLLALSFYNLVPCCSLCNSRVKGTKKMYLDAHVHPYVEGFGKALMFNYIPKDVDAMLGLNNNLEIGFLEDATDNEKVKRCRGNVQDLKLKEIYNASHTDEVADIIRKFHISSGRYIEVLAKQFPQLGTVEELYKIAFANYYNAVDFEKRPLSKLTKDIFEQLRFTLPNL